MFAFFAIFAGAQLFCGGALAAFFEALQAVYMRGMMRRFAARRALFYNILYMSRFCRRRGRLFCITKTQRNIAWFKRGSADEEKANKKQGKNFIVSKAPLCKGSCRAKARLRDCEMLRREQKEEREVSNNPSVTASRANLLANFLPFTQGRLMVTPV